MPYPVFRESDVVMFLRFERFEIEKARSLRFYDSKEMEKATSLRFYDSKEIEKATSLRFNDSKDLRILLPHKVPKGDIQQVLRIYSL